jgi:hypothetical protein
MRLTFVQLKPYVVDAKRLGLTDADQRDLEGVLLSNPAAGAVMSGTGGLRKLRHAPHGRSGGKSGGVRVGYAYFPARAHVFFVVAFGKNEQANLTSAQRNAIRALLREIGEILERSHP